MHACLDDLVTALQVTIDDLLGPRLGPGRPPKLSDAELVWLAVAQALLGARSDHHWLGFARTRLGHLFPQLPGQPGSHKRLRAAAHHLSLAIRHLAMAAPWWCDGFRLLDATPLPCGAARETVKRSALWGHAGDGYDGSHSRWSWGCKLQLLCAPTACRSPGGWPPQAGRARGRPGVVGRRRPPARPGPGHHHPGRQGFAGVGFHRQVAALGAFLVRPDRADEPDRFGSLGGMRQWIESVINTRKDQLGLEQHRGRTLGGVFVRVGQRLCALATVVWFNWQLGEPDKRSLVAYDSQ